MLEWFSRSHMFGLAEWEDETRQNEARQSSTVEAADHRTTTSFGGMGCET